MSSRAGSTGYIVAALLGLVVLAISIAQPKSERPAGPPAQPVSAPDAPRQGVSAGARIGNGHAWAKHGGEFPWIHSQAEFIATIDAIIAKPSMSKSLSNGRTAYWDSKTGTIVITDPNTRDGGTMFRPSQGKSYYDRQQ